MYATSTSRKRPHQLKHHFLTRPGEIFVSIFGDHDAPQLRLSGFDENGRSCSINLSDYEVAKLRRVLVEHDKA